MNERSSPFAEIRQIIAADQRCGVINPQDDQIWELNTSRGEPPGLALQTTYGLRAYGMRVFPRFVYKKIPISDPHSFAVRPVLEFSAPNFLSLNYSPISSIDVNQKVWVPDSHTLVGEINITNNTAALIQCEMEWVVLLNPLLTGSAMTTSQISVNTVLQGQTQHLYPVFFLTGGPQSNVADFPSLGIELSLNPNTSRKFSWALAAMDTTDASFYNARMSTAYSLDNVQIKIAMLQKQQVTNFDFDDPALSNRLTQSQQRVFQLLMPAYHQFNHVFYLNDRLPDQGFGLSEKGSEYSPDGGVQLITELFELSRLLLPARSDLVKEMLQNLLEQQGDDGTLYAQTGWNGNITKLPAMPLLVSLILDLHEYAVDLAWLSQVQPALVRSLKAWCTPEQDADADGFPEWKHLLQTGIAESINLDPQTKMNLGVLIQAAEWPSLAALLVQECQGLVKIAGLTGDTADIPWLEEQINRLSSILEQSWDEDQAFYRFRDKESHLSSKGKVLHTFRQDGSVEIKDNLSNNFRLCVKFHPRDGSSRSVECQIKGNVKHHEKTIKLSARNFHWEDESAFAVTEELFSAVKQITVTGLKRGDSLSIELPDFTTPSLDFMIPLWTGIPTGEKVEKMILRGSEMLNSSDLDLPLFLKIMWLEGLIKYDHKEIAQQFFKRWFFVPESDPSNSTQTRETGFTNLSLAGLQSLIPIKTLLQLLSIQKITDNELILRGFNDLFPKVNVQYKKFLLTLEAERTRIQDLNGESVLVTEHGTHRIVLS